MLGAILVIALGAAAVEAAAPDSFVLACQQSGGDTMWLPAAGFNGTPRTFYDGTTVQRLTVSTFSDNPSDGSVGLAFLNAANSEATRNILPYDSTTIVSKRLVLTARGTQSPISVCIRSRTP